MPDARPFLHRLLGLVAVIVLIAAACGDDGDGDADGAGDDEDVQVDLEPAEESLDEFCDLAAQAGEADVAFDPATTNPEEIEAYFRSQLALAEQGVVVAPDAIADAITVQRDVLVDAIAILEPSDWDFEANFDAVAGLSQSAEFTEAADALDGFETEECETAADDGDSADDAGSGELSAQEEAYCAHSVAMAGRGQLSPESTPDEVEAYYDRLSADLEEAASLAPPELSEDYAVIAEVFAEVGEIVETAGFDLEAAQAPLEEHAADPAVSAAMQEAIVGIEAYDAETCGF